MTLLNGSELVGFIKERQAHEVRMLRQAYRIVPKLAIIRTNPNPVVNSYMAMKRRYGSDISAEVEVYEIEQDQAVAKIKQLNDDASIHGIIVQLPLPDPTQTDEVVNTVDPAKDVDGLAEHSLFDSGTPTAINWLLAGYNIELRGKNIAIVGQGRLVGAPLTVMWRASGLNVVTADKHTKDIISLIREADVVVTATGVPGLITNEMVRPGAVVVDAGVATDKNGLVGDVADEVRSRADITITPPKGGVGPLTIAALFENVIRSAKASAGLRS